MEANSIDAYLVTVYMDRILAITIKNICFCVKVGLYHYMYMLIFFPCCRIQLLEFLISDYMKVWLCCEHINKRLFEECTRSILKARNDLQILENMNGLYVVYIERVVGRLARDVAPAAHQGKLDLEVFSKLLC